MTVDKEFFNVKYKEGSLDAKTAQLIFFAVCIAIGHEEGATLHLKRARECGATEDEIKGMLEQAGLPRSGQITLFDGRTGELDYAEAVSVDR